MAEVTGKGRAAGAPGTEELRRERRKVIDTLLEERRRVLRHLPATSAAGPDPVEAASDQEEEAVWLAALDYSRDVRVAVEEALGRLARGQYGRCADCGAAIAPARLRALPFAVRCLSCQERLEREAHRREAARASRELQRALT